MSTQSNLSILNNAESESIFVTMRIDKQLLGIDVKYVRDVLRGQNITAIPLAPSDVAGSLNSRGRIVTVIDVRKRLGLPPAQEEQARNTFVVVDVKGELYSLLVDNVGDVLTVSTSAIDPSPANLTNTWKGIAAGIYKLEGELLVLIDIHGFLRLS